MLVAKLMELLKFLQAHKAKYFADECAPRRGGVLVRVASSHASAARPIGTCSPTRITCSGGPLSERRRPGGVGLERLPGHRE